MREKVLRIRFMCDTVPPIRGETPDFPVEFSAGRRVRPPSKHFYAGTGF
jgi:hypothetical protein